MIPRAIAEVCNPRRTAVIVYDMQAGVVSQIANSANIVAAVGQVLTAARRAGYGIYFTRHQWLPNRYAGVAQLRRAMIWQHKSDPAETHPFFKTGSQNWQIVPELAPLDDEVIVDKITMSCFAGTYLDIAFRDAGIDSFIITGIAMEVGIEPTVRHALDLNYIPIVVTDACGFGDRNARDRSLATLSYTGEVLTIEAQAISQILLDSNVSVS